MGIFKKKKTVLPDNLDERQVRLLTRILFIDDEEVPKAEALRQQGYCVFHKRDITDLSDLEKQEYHLIFCDIAGVGRTFSQEEGAGLIRLIKEQVKYPIVIAYSAYGYQPGEPKDVIMREVADGVIGKMSELGEYIRCISQHGKTIWSRERCIKLIADMSGRSQDEISAAIEDSVANAGSRKPFDDLLGKPTTVLNTVLNIIRTIIALS